MTQAEIINALYEAKQQEAAARERRMELEAQLAEAIGVPDDWEGSKTRQAEGYKVVCTRKMNHRIDADKLKQIAMDNFLGMVVEQCFRWKPEIIKREWDAESEEHKRLFAPAITTTPGKVSFSVEKIEEE